MESTASDCSESSEISGPTEIPTWEEPRYTALEIADLFAVHKLTIGLKKEGQIGGDWTLFDNWQLHYMGNSDNAFAYFASDYMGKSVDYETFFDENEVYHHKAAFEAYIAARNTLAAATDAASIGAAIAAFDEAINALVQSSEPRRINRVPPK